MILSDFRYQDLWAKEKFTLPDFIQQGQAQQRYEQQKETLLGLIPPKNIYATNTAKIAKPIPLKMTLPPSRYFYPT